MDTNEHETHHVSRYLLLLMGVSLLLIGSTVAISLAHATGSESAAQELPLLDTSSNMPNCRYGVASSSESTPWLDPLGVGWTLNFGTGPKTSPVEFVNVVTIRQDYNNGVRVPTYTVFPPLTDSGLGKRLLPPNTGMLWLVGNEVDVESNAQGNTMPDIYAHAYNEVYHYIKQKDPTAQVGPAGLSMATPGRLQYLDIVWDTYLEEFDAPMPVDVWNTHLYILAERRWTGTEWAHADGKVALGTDIDLAFKAPWNLPSDCLLDDVYCRSEHDDISIFYDQVKGMRQWMKDHRQQHKPLIITEFGQLYPHIIDPGGSCFLADEDGNCFTPNRVNNYMEATFDLLESATDPNLGLPADNNRLVQQWMWFHMAVGTDESGGSSNLLCIANPPGTRDPFPQGCQDAFTNGVPGSLDALTPVGEKFLNEVTSRNTSANLMAGQAHPVAAFTQQPAGTADVILSVDFYNNGNTSINQQFDVTFYKDSGLTQAIGSETIIPQLLGCARHTFQASVPWNGLPPGVHDFWVKIDSANSIPESDESPSDNVARGLVMVDPETTSLPTVWFR